MKISIARSLVPVVLLATLPACGGGGDDAATAPVTNAPPTISGTPATQVQTGQAYTFTPQATDPEGAALTFSIDNRPAWATFDNATGRLSGTPTAANLGTFANVTIRVSDGVHQTSLAPFAIIVRATVAGAATINWTPPTTRSDGSALTNLASYRIYYGTTSASYANTVVVSNPGLTSFVVDGLNAGTYFFVVTAVDSAGIESAYSNETSKTIS